MSKVIILSNRIARSHRDRSSTHSHTVLQSPGWAEVGDVWLAWNGQRVEDTQACDFKSFLQNGVQQWLCPLTQYQFKHYYSGYAHQSLWPALHRRIDLIQFHAEDYASYQQVNAQFAQKIAELIAADDVIWIHDYHFFSVARYCRARGLANRIGFFLHTPFADLSAWQALPHGQSLIEDLSHYDVVGLQTHQDQQRCAAVMQHLCAARATQSHRDVHCNSHFSDTAEAQAEKITLLINHRSLQINCYPMGVALRQIQQLSQSDRLPDSIFSLAASSRSNTMQRVFDFDCVPRQKTILSVDRIDYAAGLFERLDTIENLLRHDPQLSKKLGFLQLARPCRLDLQLYQDLFHQFIDRIAQLNAQYPLHPALIQLSHQQLPDAQLMQSLARTNICWITSLAAGMNIMAKAYIAAQNPSDPGVLILSKYAGAAEQMTAALIVDPHDPVGMLETLHMALNMPRAERIQRYRKLFGVVHGFTYKDWRYACIQDIKQQPIRKPRLLENLKPT